ncbi:MAG TPA: hypothetical protein PLN85_00540 [archaeon]|jgi:hypothetical protein|nr:hypothetical protein [archaeon]
MKKIFKTLMYNNIFVDVNKLTKGIYETNTPLLYEENITMNDMIYTVKCVQNIIGNDSLITDEYFDNLNKCKLVDVELTLLN